MAKALTAINILWDKERVLNEVSPGQGAILLHGSPVLRLGAGLLLPLGWLSILWREVQLSITLWHCTPAQLLGSTNHHQESSQLPTQGRGVFDELINPYVAYLFKFVCRLTCWEGFIFNEYVNVWRSWAGFHGKWSHLLQPTNRAGFTIWMRWV